MKVNLAPPFLQQLLPMACRRVVVIDPGSRCLKILVVDAAFGRLRIAHRLAVDLGEEDLAPEEVRQHLHAITPELGAHQLAMVLPQDRCMAQMLELPAASVRETRRLVEAEATRLSGLADTAMQHGFTKLKPFGRYKNPHSLTLCKTTDVASRLDCFAPEESPPPGDDWTATGFCEVTPTAQALFAASGAVPSMPSNAVLVDLGANTTVVGILVEGQGVFATTLATGANRFTEKLALLKPCSPETAEAIKRSQNLFKGEGAVSGLGKVVEEWNQGLKRAISEWIEDNPELGFSPATLPVYLCGGGARQEGLLEFLNSLGPFRFQSWPALSKTDTEASTAQYWPAYGLAMLAVLRERRALSLLPPEYREQRNRNQLWRRIQTANVVIISTLIFLLAFGTWQQARLLAKKRHMKTQADAALQTGQTMGTLWRRLDAEYERIQPVLARQRQTMDTLQALATVQGARTNKSYWYLLFADSASYANCPIAVPPGTNAPAATNLIAMPPAATLTNLAPARREFVAELCIPQDGDEARRILNQVVTDLKQSKLYSKVDALPPERKRNLVDARVILTNHVFAVAMEVSSTGAPPVSATAPERPARTPASRESKRTSVFPRAKEERAPAPTAATNH